MYLGLTEVTAVLPSHGPVTWSGETVDNYAREFLIEHQPRGSGWRLFSSPADHRECTGCRNPVQWQECPFALWARSWQAQRRLTWKMADFLPADTVPDIAPA